MFELRKQFIFESAHTLSRRIEAEGSRRIHGHTYKAEIVLCGKPDANGMIMDLGELGLTLEAVRDRLDHRLLNDVTEIGPPTLENLALFIWNALKPGLPLLARVTVMREASGDACSYDGATV